MKKLNFNLLLSLALLLNINLYAQDLYTIKPMNLKGALEQIAKKSNLSFLTDGQILKGKQSPIIKEVKGTKNVLSQILKNTNLEAIIKDNTIIIKKKKILNEQSSRFGSIDIIGISNITEGTGSYTTHSMNTATKLNLSIRETPQSVSVMGRQELEDKSITSLQELLGHVTGVSLLRVDERLNSTARGFEIDYYKIDGIPRAPRVDARDDDLFLYDRVEIVRGANGLTTGAGNPGVSINLVRKKANSKEFKGSVSLTTNSFGTDSIKTDISSKLNEDGTIRGRIIVNYENDKTHLDNYETEKNLIYGVLTADLTDTTTISLGASWQTFDAGFVRSGGLSALDSNGDLIDWDVTDHFSEDWTYTDNISKEVFAELDQVLFNDIKLNIDYLHSEFMRDVALINFDGSLDVDTGKGVTYYTWKSEQIETTDGLEINLDIPFTIGGLEQQIIIGTSYTKDKVKKYHSNFSFDQLDNFYGYDISAPTYEISENTAPSYTLQKAAFISTKFSLNEQLKLISGARLSSWEYHSTDSEKESRKFTGEITPYIGLVYDINNNHSIYTSYTSIFNPQDNQDENGNYLDPVTGESYEAGVKGEYFNGKLNASLSLFEIEQKGVAEAEGVQIKNPLADAYVEVDGVTSKGFGIDINGRITDQLNLGLGIENFEAKDVNGEKFSTKSSRTTANIFTSYIVSKDLIIGGGFQYKSKFYASNDKVKITQDSFFLTNVMAKYDFNKNTSLQLNIQNIFDKKYYVGVTTSEYTYGEPRKIIANLKYTF